MDKEKHVDESWKEQASEEKDKLANTVTQETVSSETPQAQVETQSSAPTPRDRTPEGLRARESPERTQVPAPLHR